MTKLSRRSLLQSLCISPVAKLFGKPPIDKSKFPMSVKLVNNTIVSTWADGSIVHTPSVVDDDLFDFEFQTLKECQTSPNWLNAKLD